MTDITIDEANAAVLAAEKAALQAISDKITTFKIDVADIVATLGANGPATSARQFITRLQANLTMVGGLDLQSVLQAYGLAPAVAVTPAS